MVVFEVWIDQVTRFPEIQSPSVRYQTRQTEPACELPEYLHTFTL